MNTSTKLSTLFVLAVTAVACTASPIMMDTMQTLRRRLASIQRSHSDVYHSIRSKRFGDPHIVLPTQDIPGMESIKDHLRYLDENDVFDQEEFYQMHNKSLLIFREAFKMIAIEEMLLQELVKEDEEPEPTFHKETRNLYHDINGLLQSVLQIAHECNITMPEYKPNIVFEKEIDGKICDKDCEHERYLYIHQQFDYYIDRMAYSIAALSEEESL